MQECPRKTEIELAIKLLKNDSSIYTDSKI